MAKGIKLLLILGMSTGMGVDAPALAPHAYYSDIVLSAEGKPVPGATVRVCKTGTEVKARLFKGESAGTAKSAVLLKLSAAPKDASSTGWNLPASHAFDGNTGSRWSSAPGLPPASPASRSHEWIWVDLGADVPLLSVWVDYENAAAVDYTLRLLTEAEGASLGLAANGRAGGGPDKWKIIATGEGLPKGTTSPNRKLRGVHDKWDFATGTAVIPDNAAGTATVSAVNPVGRYLMVDTTKASDRGYGNVSIREITVETEWVKNGPPMDYVLYTTAMDNFVEQSNPMIADKEGRFRFFVANGDYDIHVSDGASVKYSIANVTLFNPLRPHAVRSSSKTPPLTLVERGVKTSGGNNALAFGRPGSTDANYLPTPYRMIVNKGKQGWALTLNADWDEIAGAWKRRTIGNQSFVFRINGEDHSLEYGNDSFTTTTPPVMETLFRISADGDIWTKAFTGGYNGLAMEVRNRTGQRLSVGNVVVLDPSDPFSVIAPRKHADENPLVVYKLDGSRVFVLIAGRISPNTPYSGGDIGRLVKAGDVLVTEGAGSFRAVVGREGVDHRAVIGRVSDRSLLTIVP